MLPRSRDDLLRHLHGRIMSGALPPGTKLPAERHLAEEFGLSRPIVREVLRGLHERGLVAILPARGTFVREAGAAGEPSILDSLYRRQATARDLAEARLMLERHAARTAAQQATESEIEALRRCLDDFDAAGDVIERAVCDLAFHGLLARCTHNAVIVTMFDSIAGLSLALMVRSLADPEVTREGAPHHRLILAAIRDRDPDAAERATTEHISVAKARFGSDYDLSLDELARRELGRLHGPKVELQALLASVRRQQERALAPAE